MSQPTMYDMLSKTDDDGNTCWSARDMMLTFNTFSWSGITALMDDAKSKTDALNDEASHVVPFITDDGQVDYRLSATAVFMVLSMVPLKRGVTESAFPYFASVLNGSHVPVHTPISDLFGGVAPPPAYLSVSGYLSGRGMLGDDIARSASMFGKRVAALYREQNNVEPPKVEVDLHGDIREINGYRDTDRPLFDKVWESFYAHA